MNNQDAFVIVPVSSDESVSKQFDVEVHDALTEFDERLRKNLGLKINIVQRFDYENCQQLIKSKGITSFMSMVSIKEDIMHITKDRGSIGDMLRGQLENLSPSKEIIIVDGYVFKPRKGENPEDHLKFFTDIFSSTIHNIKHINFITHPDRKDNYDYFKKTLIDLNPELTVGCNTTKEFHDRFWIIDRTKGLVIGTSLNGIGCKYALFDILRDEDTRELLKIFMELRLLD